VFVQGRGLAGAPRSVILTHKEDEAKSNELSSSHFLFLRSGWHSSKRCGRPALGPVFSEKLNGFPSSWGWVLAARPRLPGRFLVGEENGPPALVCVGPGLSTELPGLRRGPGSRGCEAWVPGAAGRWGRCLRGGRQADPDHWRDREDLLAAGKDGSPGLGASQL